MEEGRNGETDGFEGYYDDQVSKLEVPSVIYNPKHIIGWIPSPYLSFFFS